MLLHTFERYEAGPVSTPAQLTANANDYAFPRVTVQSSEEITGNDEVTFQRLSSDATRTISGFVSKGHSWLYVITNVGSNGIAFANESSLSNAANRIITGTGGTVTISAGESASFVYDGPSSRWRMFSKNVAGSGSTITVQDEGVTQSAVVTTLNFEGSGVTAVDQGGGVVDVTISSSAVEPADVIPLVLAYGGPR